MDCPAESRVPYEPRAGTGCHATEAPRGLLYHRYRIGDDGLIAEAKIVPPTSQNQGQIEARPASFRAQRRAPGRRRRDAPLRASDPQLRSLHQLRHAFPERHDPAVTGRFRLVFKAIMHGTSSRGHRLDSGAHRGPPGKYTVPSRAAWFRGTPSRVQPHPALHQRVGRDRCAVRPWVNWSGFLPVGLTLLVFLYAARDRLPVHRMSLWLFSCVGWDYLISAVFPCDPGCPERGSLSQQVHNLAAIITYPAVIAGLLQMATSFRDSRWWRHLSGLTMWCGMVVAAGFGCMLLPPWQPWRGLGRTCRGNRHFRLGGRHQRCVVAS